MPHKDRKYKACHTKTASIAYALSLSNDIPHNHPAWQSKTGASHRTEPNCVDYDHAQFELSMRLKVCLYLHFKVMSYNVYNIQHKDLKWSFEPLKRDPSPYSVEQTRMTTKQNRCLAPYLTERRRSCATWTLAARQACSLRIRIWVWALPPRRWASLTPKRYRFPCKQTRW